MRSPAGPVSGMLASVEWLTGTLWVSAVVALLVGALAWRRRGVPGARALGLLLLAIAHASFCYGAGLLAPDLASKVWWNRAEYAAAVWVGGLLLLAACQHTGRERWLRPGPQALLWAIPVVALAANWTNGWHHLYYPAVHLQPHGGGAFLLKDRGPLYWLFQFYSNGAALLTSGLLFLHWRQVARHYRGQSAVLWLAMLMPLLMNVFYLLRLGPLHGFTLAYFGCLATGLLLGWAMLRGRLLDLTPIARTVLLEHMAEAVVVLDARGRVTDFNQRAAHWFGCGAAALGQPAAALPGWGALALGAEPPVPGGAFRLDERWIKAGVTPLRSARGKHLGWLCLCQDITRQRRTEGVLRAAFQRLRATLQERSRELQRAQAQAARVQDAEQRRIGREIHDSLCQDLAGLSRTAQSMAARAQSAAAGASAGELRQMAGQAARMLRAARGFAHDLALVELEDLPLADALGAFAENASDWLGLQVELNCSAEVQIAEAEAAGHLLRIVREAVVNAASHGQAQRVWVDLIRKDGHILVSVSNDGRPLPSPAALREGLGLRGMRMRAQLLGGHLTLSDTPGGPVTLRLQLSEQLLRLPSEERVPSTDWRPAPGERVLA